MSTQRQGILWMVAAMLCWGTSGFFLEFISWDPMLIASIRAIPAGLTIYTYMRFRRMQLCFDRRVWKIAIPMFATCVLYVVGCKLSTAANAGALQQISPFFLLMVMAVRYKKPVRRCDWIAAVFTLIGVALFFMQKFEADHMWGNILGMASGITLAYMYLFMSDSVTEEVRMNATLLSDILSVFLCLPFGFFTKSTFTPISVWMLILMGIIQLGLSYVFLAQASAKCPALVCSLLSALVPPINAIWMWVCFGKGLSIMDFVGMTVILLTIGTWNIYKNRHPLPAVTEKGTES